MLKVENENIENNDLEVTNKLLMEMVSNQRETMKSNSRIFITVIVCYTIILVSMVAGFFIYESQFDVLDSNLNYEYEQEVSGNDSEINNVSGDMYKDNSSHNE